MNFFMSVIALFYFRASIWSFLCFLFLYYDSLSIDSNRLCMCLLRHFSRVQFFETLWTIAHQNPHSVGFSRQEYWSGLPCHPPGDLPNPCIKPTSINSPALEGGFFTTSTTCTHFLKNMSHIFQWSLYSLRPLLVNTIQKLYK